MAEQGISGVQNTNEGIQNSKIVANPSPVASLSLQVLMTIDYWVQWAFVYITSVLLFWKIYQFSFPQGIFFFECGIFVILALAQFTRLFLGSRGNKTESSTVTFFFLLLTVATILGNLYFIRTQTYVIVLELLIGIVSVFFAGLELIFGLIAAIEFKSLENSQ